MAEQRYQAVLAVVSDGLSISQVAGKVGVSRQTLHTWLARYEAEGLDGLKDRSHRPTRCPYQIPRTLPSGESRIYISVLGNQLGEGMVQSTARGGNRVGTAGSPS